jgi:arylsulfatase A-like enzyme
MRATRSTAGILAGASVLALVLASCDDAPRAQWISLAREGGAVRTPGLVPAKLPDGQTVEFEERDGELWGNVRVTRAEWTVSELPNMLHAPAALLGLGKPAYRLEVDGKTCKQVSAGEDGTLRLRQSFEPGTFGYWRKSIFLGIEPGTPPPELATLSVRLDTGAKDAQGFQAVHGRRFSGKGLSVWPGQRVERTLDLLAGSTLSFGTSLEPASALTSSLASAAPVTFRIEVDGQTVFEHAQAHDAVGSYAWHRVDLPARERARLAFVVDGPFAYTAFMDPVLGPAEIGSYAARPWTARPSIVVFLADTFRADNLEAYGGPAGLTPELGSFAADGLRFARAWSVGTFTLPGHAALFSGLYPRQTSSDAFNSALPAEVETIAEVLSRAGYRTGAITDSAVVSLRFGLHQGFAWFDEFDLTLDSTLERARSFLAADDGRPVFLFVHSYRVHSPYRVVEPTDPSLPPAAGSEEYHRLMAGLRAIGGPPEAVQRDPARARELAGELKELYRSGVRDLDRGFGEFWRDARARGFPEAGYVLFTSDHGEAFFEHDQLEHQGHVFEEQVRIPLLIHGPKLAPRTIPSAASLVDVPPTLAAMAGVAPLPYWQGTNLLALEKERALFAFECSKRDSTVAIIRGERKLIAREQAEGGKLSEPWRAFDLGQDPGELRDLLAGAVGAAGTPAPWPAELFRNAAPLVDALLVPLVAGEASTLGADDIEALNALGYASE